MSALTTYAKPVNDIVTVHVPNEFGTCVFQVVLTPVESDLYRLYQEERSTQSVAKGVASDSEVRAKANRELLELAGTWESDPASEAIFDEMRTIDSEMWQ